MPRFQVVTVRALYNSILIDAEDENAARHCVGEIIDESETDTWAERMHSIEQVADDCEEAELP